MKRTLKHTQGSKKTPTAVALAFQALYIHVLGEHTLRGPKTQAAATC